MDNLVGTKEAAEILGVSTYFLERDRWAGAKIPFIQVGDRAVRYRLSDLQSYIDKRVRKSTDEPGRAVAARSDDHAD